MNLRFNLIPPNWFLDSLRHTHTPIYYVGEKHEPQYWYCALQHIDGGKLCEGFGDTPQAAVEGAVAKCRAKWPLLQS